MRQGRISGSMLRGEATQEMILKKSLPVRQGRKEGED